MAAGVGWLGFGTAAANARFGASAGRNVFAATFSACPLGFEIVFVTRVVGSFRRVDEATE